MHDALLHHPNFSNMMLQQVVSRSAWRLFGLFF